MNKKLILTMTVGGVLFVGSPAMANIASQVYVDREVAAVGERVTTNEGDITTLQGTVAGHTTAIAGKAALAGVGADGVIAAVDADGQFVRDASGLTIQTLATHVQGKVTDAIDSAVTEATTTINTNITNLTTTMETINSAIEVMGDPANIAALEGRVTTAEGNISDLDGALSDVEGIVAGHVTDIGALQTGKADNATVAAIDGRVTTAEGDITTLQGTVDGHTTAIAGKAELAGVGADGVIAAVDADGQFVRDASGLTIQTLATHVQGKVADAIDAAVTEATTTLGGDVTALSGRVTTAEGTIAGHTSAITALETEKANIGDLSALAMAPVECSDEINSCVLTTNGTTLNWEVIKR